MTLTLTVRAEAWHHHVEAVARHTPGLIPVIKGNGYGLGRIALAEHARRLADLVAVGTVHELDPAIVAGGPTVVLTPSLAAPPVGPEVILTVGSEAHIAALPPRARVVVKLESSMHRYGGDVDLVERARAAGHEVVAVAIHPPLVGRRADDVHRWLPAIAHDLEVWVSHLDADEVAALPDSHRYRIRLGTALWHGDKSMLSLTADVLDVRPVSAGSAVGYRQVAAPAAGALVMVGAGSGHGVRPLPDGRSPFHHARRRLEMVEPPHMHTTMLLVPDGDPVPEVGAAVDVQQPLTTVWADVVDWA